jgi:hypothetical protein
VLVIVPVLDVVFREPPIAMIKPLALVLTEVLTLVVAAVGVA